MCVFVKVRQIVCYLLFSLLVSLMNKPVSPDSCVLRGPDHTKILMETMFCFFVFLRRPLLLNPEIYIRDPFSLLLGIMTVKVSYVSWF